jgi:hypothetical protein
MASGVSSILLGIASLVLTGLIIYTQLVFIRICISDICKAAKAPGNRTGQGTRRVPD